MVSSPALLLPNPRILNANHNVSLVLAISWLSILVTGHKALQDQSPWFVLISNPSLSCTDC
jgi:hypothetical protein